MVCVRMGYLLLVAVILFILLLCHVHIAPPCSIHTIPYADRLPKPEIPKVIWTFWTSDILPDIVRACIASWAKHNPDHRIIVVTPKNAENYIGFQPKRWRHANEPARTSDMVRITVLKTYGGIWLDASILCNAPLDWIHNLHPVDCIAYTIGTVENTQKFPVIENWFLACPSDSLFMELWEREFMQINRFKHIDDYVSTFDKLCIDTSQISSKHYLTMHLAAQSVLQMYKYPMERLHLISSEEGPFKYLKVHPDQENNLRELCDKKNRDTYPMIKFRGTDRNVIERLGLQCAYT